MTAYAGHHTLTVGRLAAIRKVETHSRVRLVPNLRDWLEREGYIEPTEPPAGPRPTGPKHSYRLPGRAYRVTAKGARAIEDGLRAEMEAL